MWILLFLLFSQAIQTPCTSPTPTGTPSLIVQVVDPNYLPVPGAAVTVTEVERAVKASSARTEEDGYVKFFDLKDSDYMVEAKISGFKSARVKLLGFHNPAHKPQTAYVQFVMKFSGPGIAVN